MTRRRQPAFLASTQWTSEQLDADRRQSEDMFRIERLEEPLEVYLDAFEDVQDAVENLLESTVDLAQLVGQPAISAAFAGARSRSAGRQSIPGLFEACPTRGPSPRRADRSCTPGCLSLSGWPAHLAG